MLFKLLFARNNLKDLTAYLVNKNRLALDSRQETIDHAIGLLEGIYFSEWQQACKADQALAKSIEYRQTFIQEKAGALINRVFSRIHGEGRTKPSPQRKDVAQDKSTDLDGIMLVDPSKFWDRLKEEPDRGILKNMQGIAKPKPLLIPTQETLINVARVGAAHPNFKQVNDRILAVLSIQQKRQRPIRLSNMLLHGVAGVGKTRYINRLAEALGLDTLTLSLAGFSDTIGLNGNSRGWANASPGKIARFIANAKHANPIILLDEIDKTGGANHAMVADILLGMLEPEQSRMFQDAYVDVHIDLSKVNFIATANEPERITSPLRSRFIEHEIQLVEEGGLNVVTSQVIEDICEEDGFEVDEVVSAIAFDPQAMMGLSVREMRERLKTSIYQSLSYQ